MLLIELVGGGDEKLLVDRKVPRSHMEEVSSWDAKADWAVDT